MFTRILLATDGSACALKAAHVALEMARKFEGRVTVLTVYAATPMIASDGVPIGYALEPEVIDEIQSGILADTCQVLSEGQANYQTRKEIGNPAETIGEVAREEGSELIVIGSRGLGGMKSFLLGSVSDRVTHLAHCPVLIVR